MEAEMRRSVNNQGTASQVHGCNLQLKNLKAGP